MTENHRFPQKLFYIFSAIETIIAFIVLARIPTDPKNIFFAGLSFNRLLLLGIMLLILAMCIFQLSRLKITTHEPRLLLNINKFFTNYEWIYYLILFSSWILIIFPAYRFGKYEVIYSRIQPLIILISSLIFTFLILLKFKIKQSPINLYSNINVKILLIYLFIVAIVWIFLITTRFGLDIDHDFWGGAATPILPLVLYTSLFIPFLLSSLRKKGKSDENEGNWIIKVFPIILFLSAILIWNLEPFTPHFFAPKVRAPNYEYYPYSDAQIYDMTAQSLLNGEGYMNRGYVQRPLYGFMLFIFHTLVGQNYLNVVFLQTILYAFFPVLIFYLGKKLFSPFIGISLGVISVLRELTAFQASPFMEIVHTKLYMTDNWASFFALLITILMIFWFMNKKENHLLLVLIGTMMGISLLMRINLLLIFIPIFVTVFLKNTKNFKSSVLRIGILGLSSFIILLPWMARNYFQIGEFGIEPQKFRMVIETRFGIEEKSDSIESGSTKPSQMIMPENNINNLLNKIDTDSVLNILRFTTANFLHNEIHSVLIFPNSIYAESINGVIRENGFIQESWVGEINLRQFIAITINLLFIGLGISISYKKYGWFGLFPLSIHLFYNLSNGLARVSGWRYVIVTDWVIILYYMVGMVFILTALLHKIGLSDIRLSFVLDKESVFLEGQQKTFQGKPVILSSLIFVVIIAIGMVMPELLIEKKYAGEVTKEEFFQLIESKNIDYDQDKMRNLEEDADFVYIHTRAFYPRYYDPGEGEPGNNIEWLLAQDYGQLGLMIISPNVAGVTIRLDDSPVNFPHNEDVLIIGKWVDTIYMRYLQADVIVLPDESELIVSFQPN
ncbi:MAG: hypothetical protein CVU41_00970 [Chloroflexi bacterium HGW-Chloroflexi-3]|nr:MAG: hypothetical protein CVU41_00970 [Chloroflexi bacterium HGW-Chloroflexi-3]